MNPRFLGWTLVLAFVGVLCSAGSITQYTSFSTFSGAVGSLTTETFGTSDCFPLNAPISSSTSIPSCTGSGGSLAAGTLQPGATYSATTMSAVNFDFNIDSGGGYPAQFLDALLLGGLTSPNALMVTFAGPVSAFGFDTNQLEGTSFSITINFVSGPSDVISAISIPTVSPTNLDFFGFQSSAQDITSISAVGSNGQMGFAPFYFTTTGAGATVPEPSQFLGIASALALLCLWRRTRRQAA